MLTGTLMLVYIFLLLLLGAVIAFSYTVIKPLQTHWAVRKGRQIVASGKIKNTWQFRNVFRLLATAGNDLEAAYLWHKLRDIKDKADTPPTG